MGGYGSGRTGWKGKVEDCRTLDVNRLSKEGCLQPGNRASLAWTVDGEQVASIGLRAEADRLILHYRVGRNGEDWTHVEEAVPLARLISDNHLVRRRQPSWPPAPAGGRA